MALQTIGLTDGRALAYREHGDGDGRPVVNCHGGLVCGLDAAPYDDAAKQVGVRIISPDRPGIGGSDDQPGRATADWASDVKDLLDALGIERTSVLGWSMGGQYALACAARLGPRVERTVVIAGTLPLDDDTTFSRINAMDRRLTRLSQHHPHVARSVFETLGQAARHAPDAFAHLTARGAVPEEAAALEALPDPGIAAAAAVALQGGHGMVEEYRAWARPWGFGPDDVRSPVTVWHGDADELVPVRIGRELSEQIPGATLTIVEGESHFLGYRNQEAVLRDLLP